MILLKPENLSEILKDQKYELVDELVLDPLMNDKLEVINLINYKLKKIKETDDFLVSKVNLVYVPFWDLSINVNNKSNNFLINGMDFKECDKLNSYILNNLIIHEVEESRDYLIEGFQDFFSFKRFFKSLMSSVYFLYNLVIYFFVKLYKSSKIMFVILLFLILISVYLIFR